MQNFSINKKTKNNNFDEQKVKEYICKYMKELKRHFDISDSAMRSIIYKIYQELSPLNYIKKWVSVVKSRYIKKLKFKR